MTPEVSIIIPTFNRREMVHEAIDSVLSQQGVDFELIVIDDGSTDGTWSDLEQIALTCNGSLSRGRMLIERCSNRGVAAARNTGSAMACARMIAFLDSDDLWAPLKLARQLAFMRANPSYAISQTDEIWIRNGIRVNPANRHQKRAGDIFIDSLSTCLISPSAVMMRSDLFRECAGFDENLSAAEDYDLWLRILVGHEVGLLNEPLVMRRAGHRGQLSATTVAIDRFRIVALLKLLSHDRLSSERRAAIHSVLAKKCAIYANGLERRGDLRTATIVRDIARTAQIGAGNSPAAGDAVTKMRTLLHRHAENAAIQPSL